MNMLYKGSAAINIDVATQFTRTPGGRYRSEGKWSGEEFRETMVEPILEKDTSATVIIDLDGPVGFTSSFLEEVFGGLVRKYGPQIAARVKARAEARPARARKAEGYMDRAVADYAPGVPKR